MKNYKSSLLKLLDVIILPFLMLTLILLSMGCLIFSEIFAFPMRIVKKEFSRDMELPLVDTIAYVNSWLKIHNDNVFFENEKNNELLIIKIFPKNINAAKPVFTFELPSDEKEGCFSIEIMGNFLYFHFDDYDNPMVTQEELKSLLSAIANGELYIKKWVLGDEELDSHLYIKFSSEQYWTGSKNMGISLQRTFAVKKIILFDAF